MLRSRGESGSDRQRRQAWTGWQRVSEAERKKADEHQAKRTIV